MHSVVVFQKGNVYAMLPNYIARSPWRLKNSGVGGPAFLFIKLINPS